jgi:hypothetical protein
MALEQEQCSLIVGMRGTTDGREGDPFWIVPSASLDRPLLPGPLTKRRREDIQLLSFLMTTIPWMHAEKPLCVLEGADPPDRIVRIGDREERVELTELTIACVRQEYATARQLGRNVERQINEGADKFRHLLGRDVSISVLDVSQLPKNTKALESQICAVLMEDRGYVGEGSDFSSGLPEQWTSVRGFYPRIGSIQIVVHRGAVPDAVIVSSHSQAEISLSEAISVAENRVREKDIPSNSVLLATVGLPDSRGYVCPLDYFLFEHFKHHKIQFRTTPRHLKAVVLHVWGTPEWLYLFRSDTNPPAWP